MAEPIKLSAEKVAAIARVTHEANRAYCKGIGDLSQAEWDFAPDWQRDSAIAGVKAKLEDPNMTPERQHEEWCRHKFVDGWSYGPTGEVVRAADVALDKRNAAVGALDQTLQSIRGAKSTE